MAKSKTTSIFPGDEVDIHYPIGPDPHGIMIGADPHGPVKATGTGHSKAHVKHDPEKAPHQMKLTKEEQDIMDGKKGEVLVGVVFYRPNPAPTVEGHDYFLLFRFYGPTQPFFDKSWKLNDLKKLK